MASILNKALIKSANHAADINKTYNSSGFYEYTEYY